MSTAPAWILHVDLDQFLASVELRRHPELAGLRILIVGLPVAQRDILEALHLIPDVVPEKDLFDDFPSLKNALPRVLAEIGAMRH